MALLRLNLHFTRSTTIKSQTLAEFVAERTKVPIQEDEPASFLLGKEDHGCWVMYFDGAFSPEGVGVGVLLVSPMRNHLMYIVHLAFSREDSTNNTAEYEGLLAGSGSWQGCVFLAL
jgi:hypothetical protein